MKPSNRKKRSETVVVPDKQLQKLYLTEDNQSWIVVGHFDSDEGITLDEFEELWSEKPHERATIKLFGKTIQCPRYTKNYLINYNFSGVDHVAENELPPVLGKIFRKSKSIYPPLNQCLVNFYDADGSIGKHSDNEKEIVKWSEIHSWTFGPAVRHFILDSKDGTKRFKITVDHNTILIMGGKCQETHIHYVPKAKTACGFDERRINVTFRHFGI